MLNRTYEDDSPPDERLGRGVLIGHPRLPTTPPPLFPSHMAQNTGNVTVRISVETQKKLDRIAAGIDRSRNWLINEALEHY